jgi:uncharacterized protein (UPF0276 family)
LFAVPRPVPRAASDPIPARAGVGFKFEHDREIAEQQPDIGWFEGHVENYMEEGRVPHHHLTGRAPTLPRYRSMESAHL